jgi:hypothetical protein
MSGVPSVSATFAAGSPASDTNIDRKCVVIGCSSVGSGLSLFMRSSADLRTARGYGDAVDTAMQVIEQKLDGGGAGTKFPVALCTVPATTPGSYGTIDVTGITGTCTAAVDATSLPLGTYENWLLVDTGGTLGTAGITLKWSLDGGRLYSNPIALGTATSYTTPNSGSKIDFGPTSTNAAYVTLAVELRADTLAHLANAVAHDGADTSAAQVALAASSVPATVSASTAVVNLVFAALVSHVVNITTVHDGPDLVAYTALAALSAATSTATGIDLANALKDVLNDHDAVALTASTAGLMGATASIASTQTYTAAANFLAGGITAMDAQPRRVKITISGSGTPADMADSVTITGFDYAGNAQTETALSLTGLGTVISTKAFKGTGLSLAFVAADGTGASFQVGYSNGGHNSADATNVITAADATYGTLVAGDIVKVRTVSPAPAAADLFTAGTPNTGAFATLAASGQTFAIVACDFDVDATLAATIKLGLDACAEAGKDVACLVRVRTPDAETSETETAWSASVAADWLNFTDFRQVAHAGYGLTTDAATGRVYQRSTFAQLIADVVRVDRVTWPCSPNDRPRANVRLSNSNGTTVGHDEGARGVAANLSVFEDGNRFSCDFRSSRAPAPELVYGSMPFTLYGPTDAVKNLPTLRVCLAIKRVALSAAFLALGGTVAYNAAEPGVIGSVPTLPDETRNALQGAILQALAAEFANDIQNASDKDIETGLVRIPTTCTVSGGNLVTISASLAPKVFGYIIEIPLTIAVQE